MSAECKIILENVANGNKFNYPAIILQGYIKSTVSWDCIHVKSNDNNFFDVKCLKNSFKTLLELQPGKNVIIFKSGTIEEEFVVFYEPKILERTILPLYIICEGHNGCFQAPECERNDVESALNRINTCTKLIQCIIAEKLNEIGMERKTVHFESGQIFRSTLNLKKALVMSQKELWDTFGREIAGSPLGHPNRKFLAFLSCTNYCGEKYDENTCKSYLDLLRLCEGYVALGGGGLALLGTASMHTWPENLSQVVPRLLNDRKIDRKLFLDDSSYRGTYGACFETTLGSTLHELCHVFDLGHTEKGIMGEGFGNIGNFFKATERIPGEKPRTLRKYLRDDGSYWTKSSLSIMFYHKWFNSYCENSDDLKYQQKSRFLTSTCGLRVVELRNVENEMVLKSWTFDGKLRKFSFQIPDEEETSVLLVVADNSGNILKEKITVQ